MKGDQSKGIHGDYCSHCGHYSEARGPNAGQVQCECRCHDKD